MIDFFLFSFLYLLKRHFGFFFPLSQHVHVWEMKTKMSFSLRFLKATHTLVNYFKNGFFWGFHFGLCFEIFVSCIVFCCCLVFWGVSWRFSEPRFFFVLFYVFGAGKAKVDVGIDLARQPDDDA